MTILRALVVAASLALAACVAPASQGGAQDGAAVAQPASPATKPAPHRLRTGGPNPPQRIEAHCAVDADCAGKPQCADDKCRCVKDRCIVLADAIDPSIDPAPATSVR